MHVRRIVALRRLDRCSPEETPVRTVRRSGSVWQVEAGQETFEAPVLVNAAGAWADRIAAQLGEEVPLLPSAFMLMISAAMPPFLKPVLGATGRPLSFKQFRNGTVQGWRNMAVEVHLHQQGDQFARFMHEYAIFAGAPDNFFGNQSAPLGKDLRRRFSRQVG